ncbi:MAG: hypothetical protein AAFN51_08865, partial [Pseudomonadota bacterium]
FTANAAFNNLGRPLWSTAFNWSRDAAVIPILAFAIASGLGPTGAVWVQAMAAILVGSAAAITGWIAVGKIARRDAAPTAIVDVPTPAFSSGRVVMGLTQDVPAAQKEAKSTSDDAPLASDPKNR